MNFVRALGMLQVVLFHVLFGLFTFAPKSDIPALIDRLPSWMNFAWHTTGVEAIFLVSAYLLTRRLITEHRQTGHACYRSFAIKRLSRILPLYWLAVLTYGFAGGHDVLTMVLSALFIGVTTGAGNVIPVGWSMEVMMQFYIVLPLIVTALIRTKRPVVWALVAFAIFGIARLGFMQWAGLDPKSAVLDVYHGGRASEAANILYHHPLLRLSPFLFGVALGFAEAGQHRAPRFAPWVGAILMIITLWAPIHVAGGWVYDLPPFLISALISLEVPLFSLGLGLALWPAVITGAPWARRLPGPWAVVSDRIFGIYLFHFPFLLLAALALFQTRDPAALGAAKLWHIWAIFALTVISSTLFSSLLRRIIEKPAEFFVRRRFTLAA